MAGRESAARRGYDTRWRRYRETYLSAHPLCVMCWGRGTVSPATVVDHITPHQGDHKLFWDPANHQALCAPCHDGDKRRLERSGRVVGCSEDGTPLDPAHHWRAGPRAAAAEG